MAQHAFIKSAAGILVPATPEDRAYLDKTPTGGIITGDFKRARNPAFHRKFFSLLNLGFQYWTPAGGAISPSEADFVRGYVRYLVYYAGNTNTATLLAIAEEYLAMEAEKRADGRTLIKSFDAYRAWAIIQSGYYDEFIQPDGLRARIARSISFSKMDELEFAELYKSVLNTLWTHILSKSFPTPEAANDAAYRLMEYA